ncbi:hypothetical protein [Sinomonas sp. B1-1]|uniref:hypothetical protein n=1 Tax=Sinomonas sp. B1-1 TaxID=3141454 RepID=UPI003D2D2AF7
MHANIFGAGRIEWTSGGLQNNARARQMRAGQVPLPPQLDLACNVIGVQFAGALGR